MQNMRVKPLNLNYLSILKLIFFVCIFLILALLVYFPNYSKWKKIREANQKVILQNKALIKEIENIKKSSKDPALYEKLARDNLGVAKDNEIVVDIRE